MTNKSDVLEKLRQEMADADVWHEKKKKVQEKRILVDDYKLTNELSRIQQAEEDVEKVSAVNVNVLSDDAIKTLQTNTRYFLEGAKSGMMFLNEEFHKIIPFYSGNMILVGSRTGGGKSSTTANLIYTTMKQTNRITNKKRKVLVISCEETAESVYARLTCLYKGWNFNKQQDFTDEQKEELIGFIPKWAKSGGVTIIGEDGTGITQSLEGIKSIFDKLMRENIHYDLVLIDYIQKINQSKKNLNMKSHEVMRAVVNYLDGIKNSYPAVITIFSQLSAQNEENTKSFEERLRGCHDLMTPCTVALEIIPDYKASTSQFLVHKNRYNGETVASARTCFFDKGHFLPMNDELRHRSKILKEQKEKQETLGSVFKSEEKNDEQTSD